ncbi:substrate-binding domain-containing protein [Paenibacillus sp. P26]|nr:substrate-binding domain-containing protein [Paenibacillus sp. P26]
MKRGDAPGYRDHPFVLFLCRGDRRMREGGTRRARPHPRERKKPPRRTREADRTFAIIYSTADVFYREVTLNAEKASREIGTKLIVKAPDEAGLEQQIRMMENLIKQHVDGIAISPIDVDALTPYINKAMEAGIKVICFDNDAPQSDRLAFIGIDNYEAGRKMAQFVKHLLGGQGMVIAETGMASFSGIRERVSGFRDELAQSPDLQLLELRTDGDNADRATANLEMMIQAHPHFDVFVGLDSVAGSAALLVWKAKGRASMPLPLTTCRSR